jgi:hypothetical protein
MSASMYSLPLPSLSRLEPEFPHGVAAAVYEVGHFLDQTTALRQKQ